MPSPRAEDTKSGRGQDGEQTGTNRARRRRSEKLITLNPKSEGRRKSKGRNPNRSVRFSEFGFRPSFGLRISDFGLRWNHFCFSGAGRAPRLRPTRARRRPTSCASQSGQFIIHAGQAAAPFAPAFDLGTDRTSCGWTREADRRDANESSKRFGEIWPRNAPWRSKIHLYLHPANGSDETITITSEQFTDGWQYGVCVCTCPTVVEPRALTRSIVQVLLLEMANRNAGAHGAEIPLWLTEGLTQQLLAEKEAALIPPPPHRGVKSFDRLEVTRTLVDIRTTSRSRRPTANCVPSRP